MQQDHRIDMPGRAPTSGSTCCRRQIARHHIPGLLSVALLLAGLVLPSQASAAAGRTNPTPTAYLTAALTWLQDYDVRSDDVQWPAIRRQAQALAHNAHTIADTYPAISYAIEQLGDRLADFYAPNQPNLDSGYAALYPDGLVVSIEPGGPAARAGLRLGDRIQQINGRTPRQALLTEWVDQGTADRQTLVVRRADHAQASLVITLRPGWTPATDVTGRRIGTLGYLQLPETGGAAGYATQAQGVMQRVDSRATCGWVIDLRQTWSGDIWSYLAAVGPILGDGKLGGFVYRGGRKEPWTYVAGTGTVWWNYAERPEDQVGGQVYTLWHAMPPVAVLVDQTTSAAGELVAVAFAGRPGTRTFGQPTWGTPTFEAATTLSDGTSLYAAGAYSYDRTGQVYQGPIIPDVRVTTDWTRFGTNDDPVVQAATNWLQSQPGCTR